MISYFDNAYKNVYKNSSPTTQWGSFIPKAPLPLAFVSSKWTSKRLAQLIRSWQRSLNLTVGKVI